MSKAPQQESLAPRASSSSDSGRKPYRRPELVTYGDIRQVTQTLNVLMGNFDGMMIGPIMLKTGGV